jgi:hypothetical protein
MQIPEQQKIRVEVPWLESFKLAYMQYICFLALTYVIFYKVLLGLAFKNKVVPSTVYSEI